MQTPTLDSFSEVSLLNDLELRFHSDVAHSASTREFDSDLKRCDSRKKQTTRQYQNVTFEPMRQKKKKNDSCFPEIMGVGADADVISARLHRVTSRWNPVFQVSTLKSTTSAFVYFQ